MEVFIKRLNFILVTAGVLASNITYAKSAPQSIVDQSDASTPFYFSTSKKDLEFGRNLIAFHRDLEKFKINKTHLDYISNKNNKTSTYSNLSGIINRYKDFEKINNLNSFYKNCEIKLKTNIDYFGKIEDRLSMTGDRFCRNKFLTTLLGQKNIKMTEKDHEFFKNSASFYAQGESNDEVISLLKAFTKNETVLEKLSNHLINHYVESTTKPSKKMLAVLKPNNSLNLFLKANSHLDNKSNSYFQDEFQKLNKLTQESIQNENYKLARKRVDMSLDFFNKNKKFLNSQRVWNQLIITGRAFYTKGQDKDAIDLFKKALDVSPKENYSEAMFYTVWPYIANQDFKELKRSIDKYKLEEKFDTFDSKLQFWIAYTLYKTGYKTKANKYFNQIVTNSPFSFYSIISLKELAFQNKDLTEEQIISKLMNNDSYVDYPLDKLSSSTRNTLKRFTVWNKLDDERFQTLEQRTIQGLSKKEAFESNDFAKNIKDDEFKEYITMNVIKLLHKHENYLGSFRVFQNSLNSNSLSMNYKLIKYVFPLSYMNIVEKHSQDLDPIWVLSLIRQESAFNPNATSRVGARGLMQLMPATAKRMKKTVKTNQLSNPEINVELGAKYLRQLFTKFDGNIVYTLASYNAGENRIVRWRKELFRNDDPLATIESIPFEETRNYVKLIYRNYFFYSLLSNKSVLMTSIADSFKLNPTSQEEAKLTTTSP